MTPNQNRVDCEAGRTISKTKTVVAKSAITDRATVEQSSAVDKESFTTGVVIEEMETTTERNGE